MRGFRSCLSLLYCENSDSVRNHNDAGIFSDKIVSFLQRFIGAGSRDHICFPHQVVIDLKEEQTISGFRYLPRAEEGFPGMIKGYKAYVKATPFAM